METVKIVECPRDAWQGLPHIIPSDRKAEYLRGLISAGFRHIDAVSFVSPKAVPQMADSELVLEQLGPTNDVEIIGIVVNEKGAERAINTKAVKTLGYPCSTSETFLRRNQNQSTEENRAVLKTIKNLADKAGLGVVAYLSMGFGNPYHDPWSERKVAETARRIVDMGITAVSIADTVGAAGPDLIQKVLATVLPEVDDAEVGIHMHSSHADAAAKVLAAFDAGCRRFDCALGGLGGCPFAQDALIGNVPTEEVLGALERRGVDLPIKGAIDSVVALNAKIGAEFSGSGD